MTSIIPIIKKNVQYNYKMGQRLNNAFMRQTFRNNT